MPNSSACFSGHTVDVVGNAALAMLLLPLPEEGDVVNMAKSLVCPSPPSLVGKWLPKAMGKKQGTRNKHKNTK